MFVRGGVYRVVKEALGGTLAKFSVSALMFDYVLTGPISGVSAGQYLVGVINELFHHAGPWSSFERERHCCHGGDRWSRSISGGKISKAFRNPAAKRCASWSSLP